MGKSLQRHEVTKGHMGQIHHINSLTNRHQPIKFYGIDKDVMLAKDWLEVVEEAIEIFKMSN